MPLLQVRMARVVAWLALQLVLQLPQNWASVWKLGCPVREPSQLASTPQASPVEVGPTEPWQTMAPLTQASVPAEQAEVEPGGAGGGTLHGPIALAGGMLVATVKSIWPSQLSSMPLQVSTPGSMLPWQTMLPPAPQTVVPSVQGKMLLVPQATPTLVGLSSMTPSQSSSRLLQSSGSWPGTFTLAPVHWTC
mgnify:CR=1 FL=1